MDNNFAIDTEIIIVDFEEINSRVDLPKKNMATAYRRYRKVVIDLVNGRRGEC